jgi:glycosyltransferase involved in cell wall biosynthesis
MKVVQINGAAQNGSTGRIVSQLSDVMTFQGIENYIITSGYKERNTKDNVYVVSNDIKVKIHQIEAYILGDAGFHSNITTRHIIQILDSIKPDVVHLHHIYGFWLNVEVLLNYLKKNEIHVVWTIHDFWPITGHCTHFEAIGCEKWKSECGLCEQKRSYPYSLIFDRSKELYVRKKKIFQDWDNLHIITVSEWVAHFVKLSYLREKVISVIPNGVDLEVFHFDGENIRPAELQNKFIILGVAMSWSLNKGLNDFIQMSKKLEKDERIILIGLSDNQKKNLPENVIGLSRTNSVEELRKYYCAADVYVSPSIEETMGMTVAEALACGTPAVVYKNTALTELITPATGVAVEQGYNELYEGIRHVKAAGKEKYVKACRNYIIENYEKTKQYEKYCEYYRSILRGKL